jgi:myo-inositol-1(or 4)-monophosphatase
MDALGKIATIEQKESISSVVTEIDIKCNKIIIQQIQQHFPQHNYITEEAERIQNNSEYTWVIDPLDGTSNYAVGLPWFGILIALFKKNEPIIGAAYIPTSNDFYYAEKGKGAFKNNEQLKIQSIKLKNSLVAFSTDSSDDIDYQKKGIKILKYLYRKSRNVRSTNCLLDILWVSENKFGACINLYTKIWDIAAIYLIIKEAGGIFMDINFERIDFKLNEIEKNYGIVVVNNLTTLSLIKHSI